MLTVYGFAGVDFGTLKTVIAVARNRGVDVVRTMPAIPRPPREPSSPTENR
jgi:molecular chaperone DnaK (HSP70)